MIDFKKKVRNPKVVQVEMEFEKPKEVIPEHFEYSAEPPVFTEKELKEEIWKPIPGYKKYYAVSNLGRLKRLEHSYTDSIGRTKNQEEKIMNIKINPVSRNIQVRLFHPEKGFNHLLVHRIVYAVFREDADSHVYHINGNKCDNRITNLSTDLKYAATRKTKAQSVFDGEETFTSIADCAKKHGISPTAVLFRCRSKNFKKWYYVA